MLIWRTYTIESAHWLPLVPKGHKCGRMHGHNWRIRVELKATRALHKGWVVDFALLDDIVQEIIGPLDHSTLNDTIENPTSENLALYIRDALVARGRMPEDARWHAVEVSENDSSGARVEAE